MNKNTSLRWALAVLTATTVAAAEPPAESKPNESAQAATPREQPAQEAAPEETTAEKPRERCLSLDSRTMTGDWGGLRTNLEDHGVRINVFFNSFYGSVLKGGINTEGKGRNAGSMDALIRVDLDKAGMIPDAELLLHLQTIWGGGINARTGALAQVHDDADNLNGLHVAQLWYRHHFFDRRLSLRLGFLDYQTILDRNAFANSEDKQFMHQTLDNNPLVPLNIGLGAEVTIRPCDWYTLIIGAGDAQSGGYTAGFDTAFHDEAWFRGYIENAFHVEIPSERGPLAGNYRIGLLYDPQPRSVYVHERRSPRMLGHNLNWYLSIDQMLYRENPDDTQGLGVFARFAWADPDNHRIARFWSAGMQYKGLLPERNADVLGFACAMQESSHSAKERTNRDFGNETVYELYYAIKLTKWLTLTPDIQYIDNPGGADEHGHAIVAALRLRVSL